MGLEPALYPQDSLAHAALETLTIRLSRDVGSYCHAPAVAPAGRHQRGPRSRCGFATARVSDRTDVLAAWKVDPSGDL